MEGGKAQALKHASAGDGQHVANIAWFAITSLSHQDLPHIKVGDA